MHPTKANVKRKLRAVFPQLIETYYPDLRGLPPDDLRDFLLVVRYVTRDDLERGSRLEGNDFLLWARDLFKKFMVECFRHEVVDALVDNAVEALADHPEMPRVRVHAAVEYYAARTSFAKLLRRLEDRPEEWLHLIAFVERERRGDGAGADEDCDSVGTSEQPCPETMTAETSHGSED